MYKLIKINEAAMTRTIELKNLSTNSVETCFDDSGMKTIDNFDFMEIDKDYECKILLFGVRLDKPTDSACLKCKIIKQIEIGHKKLIEVHVNKDIYYLDEKIGDEEYIFYNTARKDIVQVNDVIHHDLLY